MTDQNDKTVIDRIKLISQYTKVDSSPLETIDLFLYYSEKRPMEENWSTLMAILLVIA